MISVLFVRIEPYESEDYTHPHNTIPPLDIGYATALLETKGFQSRFIDLPVSGVSEPELIDLVKKENVKFVFIKFMTPSFEKAVRLAQSLNKKTTVIGIGHHPSTLPETCIENGFQACIVGEPEEVMLQIVEKNTYRLRGVVYREKDRITGGAEFEVHDVDALPFPKHELFAGKYHIHYPTRLKTKAKWGFIQATRGCPHNCTFCSPTLRVSWGKRIRLRDKGGVVDELELLKEMGVNVVYVMDDNLGASRRWLIGLCDEIIRRNVRLQWVTQIRVDSINQDLITKMKKAGCTTLCIGVESGVDTNLKKIKKGQTIEMARECFRLAHEHDILTTAFFMIGVPGETEGCIRKSIGLMKELRPHMIQVSFFTAYPGSIAYENLGDTEDYSNFLHYNKIVSNRSKVGNDKLLGFQKEFYRSFYLNPQFVRRYLKTRLPYLIHNPGVELGVILRSLKFFLR